MTRIHDLEGHEVESITLYVQRSRRAKKVLVSRNVQTIWIVKSYMGT